jgi:hypothetical protein
VGDFTRNRQVRAEQNQRALEIERRRVEALAEIDRAKTQFLPTSATNFALL